VIWFSSLESSTNSSRSVFFSSLFYVAVPRWCHQIIYLVFPRLPYIFSVARTSMVEINAVVDEPSPSPSPSEQPQTPEPEPTQEQVLQEGGEKDTSTNKGEWRELMGQDIVMKVRYVTCRTVGCLLACLLACLLVVCAAVLSRLKSFHHELSLKYYSCRIMARTFLILVDTTACTDPRIEQTVWEGSRAPGNQPSRYSNDYFYSSLGRN
jgi:hypothetical protein